MRRVLKLFTSLAYLAVLGAGSYTLGSWAADWVYLRTTSELSARGLLFTGICREYRTWSRRSGLEDEGFAVICEVKQPVAKRKPEQAI